MSSSRRRSWTTDRLSALVSGIRSGKSASVGAVSTVFDFSLNSLLIVFFDVVNELVKLVGAELAIVVVFIVNDRWTFVGAGSDLLTAKIRRFVKSNLVRSSSLLVQVLVTRVFGEVSLSIPVANVDLWGLIPLPLAIGVPMLLNYVAESLFTWRIATRLSQRDSRRKLTHGPQNRSLNNSRLVC